MSTATNSSDPFVDLTATEIETELLSLAGHIAAAQCRFLQLLAEFDRRAGWAGPGLRSCAHWLCWRAGMSLRTAAEHVRVAHALEALPQITAAFAAGRISYSKVRAITRIAGGPGTDGSGRPARRVGPDGGSGATAAGLAGSATDREATLLALALAGTTSHVEAVVRATRRRQADAAQASARRSLSWHWDEDGSLVLRGRFAAAEGAALIAAIDALVPPREAVRHPVPEPPPDWKQRGDEESPGAAGDRFGARRADALVDLVAAGAAARDESTATDVRRGQARVVVVVEATSGAAAIDGGPEVSPGTAERLACDAEVQVLLQDRQQNRLYLGRRRRLASPAQITALIVRDSGRCRFPGCVRTRHLQAHHVQHWFRGGRTDIDNLVLLCGFHHGLIHDSGYSIQADGRSWIFRRPDGTPVPAAPAPLTGNSESMIEINTRARLRITRNSLTPTWAGERLDIAPILDRLLPPGAWTAA